MKAIEIQQQFGLRHLALAERAMPEPAANEVLVKMKAVTLNARDLGVIEGFYFPDLPLPLVPVSDGVGEVVATGSNVTRFRVGDRVNSLFVQGWISGEPIPAQQTKLLGGPADGMLAEYVVLHEDGLVGTPEHLTDAEAAALPCAGVTAWQAVVEEGRVKAGETVVVQGTGGVSLFALQFAKLHGARVIITSSSEEKLAQARRLGADCVINYKQTPDWEQAILEQTNGRGADLIVDLGGNATLHRSIAAIRTGGRISLVGILSGAVVDRFPLIPIFQKKIRLQGINVGSRAMHEAMNRAIASSQLRPVIDSVYPFEQAIEALHAYAQGGFFGKVAIVF